MATLMAELQARGIEIPFLQVRDSSPEALKEDLARIKELLGRS